MITLEIIVLIPEDMISRPRSFPTLFLRNMARSTMLAMPAAEKARASPLAPHIRTNTILKITFNRRHATLISMGVFVSRVEKKARFSTSCSEYPMVPME